MALDPAVALAATTTTGGVGFIIRLVIKYQHDFTDRYSRRIGELEGRLGRREHEIQGMNVRINRLERDLMAAQVERSALRAIVAQHGIPWEPIDWGAIRDGDE